MQASAIVADHVPVDAPCALIDDAVASAPHAAARNPSENRRALRSIESNHPIATSAHNATTPAAYATIEVGCPVPDVRGRETLSAHATNTSAAVPMMLSTNISTAPLRSRSCATNTIVAPKRSAVIAEQIAFAAGPVSTV